MQNKDGESMNSMSVEDVLDELKDMEGSFLFQCADCTKISESVIEWGQHALDQHPDRWPGVEPIRKQ